MYFYHPDHLGSSSYITDREGRITQHTEYIAFGEVLFEEHSTSKTMPYLFNGKELDTETGLYYYGARYYDSKTSIFLNVDPLTEKTMTPYAYTNNNPINLIDPTGMESETATKPSPVEMAAMAAYVYGDLDSSSLQGGWWFSKKKLRNVKLEDKSSGFKSMLFERKKADGTMEYAYVTAGTEDLIKDGSADIKQIFGVSRQYEISVANAKEIVKQLGNAEITFGGHSLGGGEAATNSMATGKPAITFNAAGISSSTYINLNLKESNSKNIEAYIMTNDPLNMIQNNVLGIPDVNGNRRYISPNKTSGGHSMRNMLIELGGSPKEMLPTPSWIAQFENYLRNATTYRGF